MLTDEVCDNLTNKTDFGIRTNDDLIDLYFFRFVIVTIVFYNLINLYIFRFVIVTIAL